MKKSITAGYLWQGKWTGPGFPIYPDWWSDKPSKDKPYFTQSDYDRHQEEMKDAPPEEILDIKSGTYTLVVDYPVSKEYKVEIRIPKRGTTRQQLMDIAAEAYHQVYKSVNEGIYADGDDSNEYGIWGHSMGDLTIHTFYIENDIIKLGVDS
jgi:hypothetical protein